MQAYAEVRKRVDPFLPRKESSHAMAS